MKFKTSKYIAYSEAFEQANKQKRIVYSTRTGISSLIDEDIFQKVFINDFSNLESELINSFFAMELIVPKNEDEFNEILEQNLLYVENDDQLSLTIQPTADCQLGCHYCAQVHSKINMSEDVVEKTLTRIKNKIKTKKFKDISIMWYGGEPLKALNLIRTLSNEILALTKPNNINYNASMITNGLSLKPDIFKELYLQHNIYTYQITLDGTAELHDKRRITKNGGNATFDIILNNIINITDLDIYQSKVKKPILIRMNIDKTNKESVVELINMLAKKKLQNKIQLSLAPVVDWGEKKYGTSEGYTKKEFSELETELFFLLFQLGFHDFNELIPKRAFSPCMVVLKNSAEVIDAYGNIYPCYEFTYTPTYNDDTHKIGNLLNENFTPNESATTRTWYEDVKKDNFSTCKNCELFPVCGGGCVKNWYVGDTGCPSFKFNFGERLVMDYLIKNNALNI